MLNSGFESMP